VEGGGITEQTYYRWREEYDGLKLEQAKRLKELEKQRMVCKRIQARSRPMKFCRRWSKQ
jgi:hypothetical protein